MSFFPSHRISNSDDIRSGNAASSNRAVLGVPLEGANAQAIRVISLGAPIAADADGVSVSQSVTIATTPLATITGALASGGVATFDVPRNVVGAWTGTAVVTVTGTDVYGRTIVESSASGTSLLGKKAFKTVTSVSFSANVTAATIGTGTVLGLPYRPVKGGFLRGRLNEDTADAGTYAAPERTASTATSNDVRGTYTPAGSLDGVNVYTVAIAVQNGPNDSDAFGITPFSG